MPISGSCLCGGIQFEIDRAEGPVEICHCNRCRKVSGSANLVAVGVRKEDYRFIAGEELITIYEAPVLNDPPAYTSMFCSRCGSQVPPPVPEQDWFEICAGLFDDDIGVRPDKHIFIEFAPPWDDIADTLPKLTVRDLVRERHGTELADNYSINTHYGTMLKI
jgi:hypothetical protein